MRDRSFVFIAFALTLGLTIADAQAWDNSNIPI